MAATHYITANQGSLLSSSGDTVYLAEGVTLSGGIDMRGGVGGDQSINVYGTVFGELDDYFDTGSGNDHFFIGSTGKVTTDSFGALKAGGGKHVIVNQGTLSASHGLTIYLTDQVGSAHLGERDYITNTGTIVSLDTAGNPAIWAADSGGVTIDNSGDILGPVGEAITLSDGDNVVTNTGRIQGRILFGTGNDVFDSRGGVVSGPVLGDAGDDTLFGSAGDDTLVGDTGNDRLDGHLGADIMIGGDGDDRYWVDSSDDVVDEDNATYGGSGSDIITSSISFDLSDTDQVIGTVERLVLQGAADLGGTGSAHSETIVGNAGNNVLRGGAGNDTLDGKAGDDKLVGGNDKDKLYGRGGEDALFGGAGDDVLDGGTDGDTMAGGADDDTYLVDDIDDIVDEGANGSNGIDLVKSSISLKLTDTTHVEGAVENLTLTGSDSTFGVGNALANAITGNSAANTIDGGAGNDSLTGGGGVDKFRFSTDLVANVDTIDDFVHNTDKIVLDSAIFSQLSAGALSAGNFAINAPSDANDFIIYNTTTGALTYDTNGSGSGGARTFATLTGVPGITQGDFLIT